MTDNRQQRTSLSHLPDRTAGRPVRLALLVACIVATVSGTAGATWQDPQRPTADAPQLQATHGVAILGAERPHFFRLELQDQSRPFIESWQRFAQQHFAALDRDGNGSLSDREWDPRQADSSQLAGTQTPQSSFLSSLLSRFKSKTPPPDVPEPQSPQLGLGEFLKQYRDHSPELQLTSSAAPRQAMDLLWELLDQDQDRCLTLEECHGLDAVIRRFDVDHDGSLHVAELIQLQNPLSAANRFAGTQADKPAELIAWWDEGSMDRAAGELARRYADLLVSEAKPPSAQHRQTLAKLDANGDGILNASEWKAALQAAMDFPSLQVHRKDRQFQVASQEAAEEQLEAKTHDSGLLTTRTPSMLCYRQPDLQVCIGPASNQADQLSFVKQFFASYDSDNNKYLDESEAANLPFFRQSFSRIDADQDGKLFEEEVDAYLAHLRREAGARVQLSLANFQRSLFALLDHDQDFRLTARELKSLVEIHQRYDRDQDGELALAELPECFAIRVAQGTPRQLEGLPVAFGGLSFQTPTRPMKSSPDLRWHLRMDRNQDGDVSAREFLGKIEQFREWDLNGDGLISQAEASQVSGGE